MALSDAKTNDAQAGYETGMGAVLAALAGINVVSGPGMLNFETTRAWRSSSSTTRSAPWPCGSRPGSPSARTPWPSTCSKASARESEFLSRPHTRKWYRREHLLARMADRNTYEAWLDQGAKSQAERARDRVAGILAQTPLNVPDDALRRELVRIAAAEAARCGVGPLPETRME